MELAQGDYVSVRNRKASPGVQRNVFEGDGGAGSDTSVSSITQLVKVDENRNIVSQEVKST